MGARSSDVGRLVAQYQEAKRDTMCDAQVIAMAVEMHLAMSPGTCPTKVGASQQAKLHRREHPGRGRTPRHERRHRAWRTADHLQALGADPMTKLRSTAQSKATTKASPSRWPIGPRSSIGSRSAHSRTTLREDELVEAIAEHEIVVSMRERTVLHAEFSPACRGCGPWSRRVVADHRPIARGSRVDRVGRAVLVHRLPCSNAL